MLERLLIAGSGGQGIVMAGRLLASVALDSAAHVTFFPAYGAEVRGGTCNCQVVLSSNEIASPVSESFDSMILMNQTSYELFIRQGEEDALVLLSSSNVPSDGRQTIALDATGKADELGDVRAANLIMLGCYLSHKPVVAASAVENAISKAFSDKGMDIAERNLRAFRLGIQLG